MVSFVYSFSVFGELEMMILARVLTMINFFLLITDDIVPADFVWSKSTLLFLNLS